MRQGATAARPQILGMIPDDVDPTRETLKAMRLLVLAGKVSPRVRQLAESVVAPLRGKDYRGEVEACFDCVADRVRYLRDPFEVEMLHTTDQALDSGQADCDGQAVLLAAMLESIGHRTRFCAVGFQPHIYTHVYCETPIGHKIGRAGKRVPNWHACDTTEPHGVGWRPPGIVCVQIIHNRK